MSPKWNNTLYDTFAAMRDDVVFNWLSQMGSSSGAEQVLADSADEQLLEQIYSKNESRIWMEDAGLSREDVAEALKQARLGVEAEGLS